MILTPLVKGIYDMESMTEVLSKDPQMDLAATILFIEARETRMRSTGNMSGSNPASSQADNEALVGGDCEQDADRGGSCRNCGRNRHGRSPDGDTRKETCPAWDKNCSGFSKKHCQSKEKIPADGNKNAIEEVVAMPLPLRVEECRSGT